MKFIKSSVFPGHTVTQFKIQNAIKGTHYTVPLPHYPSNVSLCKYRDIPIAPHFFHKR